MWVIVEVICFGLEFPFKMIPPNKNYMTIFLNFSYMFPTNVCFEIYDKLLFATCHVNWVNLYTWLPQVRK